MPDYVEAVEPTADDFAATFEEQEETPVVVPPPSAFPDEVKLPFQGMLFIGELRKTFEWFGHTFTIRTLKTNELLEVGMITSRFLNTLGESRAYSTAVVAACLETVDGSALPIPVIRGQNDVEYRFTWATTNLYPPVIDAVYGQYKLLEDDVDGLIEAMGKAGGSTAG